MKSAMDIEDDLLDTRESAKYLGLREQTLRLYRSLGIGPRFSVLTGIRRTGQIGASARIHYRRRDLYSWFKNGKRAEAMVRRWATQAKVDA